LTAPASALQLRDAVKPIRTDLRLGHGSRQDPRATPEASLALYSLLVTALGALALAALAGALALFAGVGAPALRSRLRHGLVGLDRAVLGWATLVSLIAVSGSLYFSEVVGFIPCRLCWYQRIAMYPLLPVLGVSVLRRDAGVWRYVLPLSILGFATSAYHVAVQRLPAVEPAACGDGVPCSAIYVAVFGVVSIPVMAGAAFLLITALMFLARSIEAWSETADGVSPEGV